MRPAFTTEERLARSTELGIIVDPECYHLLEMFTWSEAGEGHLITGVRMPDGSQKKHYLHHLVIGTPPEGYHTDHEDRNPLNNRRSNLQHVTPSRNSVNSARCDGAACIYIQRNGAFLVSITRDSQRYPLGTYRTLDEAERVRDEWLEKYRRGEVA